MSQRRFIASILCSCFLLLSLMPLNLLAAEVGPRQQLEISINRLLDVLRDESLKGEEKKELRREHIAEVVFLQFDMRQMAKLSLGRDWNDLSEAECRRFTELFKALLKESYVATIDGYANEKISYVKEIINGSKAEVQTKVISPSREIPLSYKLLEDAGRWLVYDVIIENVSLVRNYRSQFGPIMRKDGFTGLLAQMEKKIAQAGEKKDG